MKFIPSALKVQRDQFGYVVNICNLCPSCNHKNINHALFCENCAFQLKSWLIH
jgi:hypothetical protein